MKIQTSALEPGSAAPEFDLPLAGGGRASRTSVAGAGRSGLLIFFKTECPTCKLAFPYLQRIYARIRNLAEPPGFLAIAQNHAGELPEFLSKYDATFPVATELEPFAASYAYGITNVPSIFLIDEHGVVLKTVVGFNKKELESILRELLARSGAPAGGPLFTDADAGVPPMQPG